MRIKKIGGDSIMKVIQKTIQQQLLFEQGVEMAKMEVSENLWYNLNVDRIELLVSFCMDYICYETGCRPAEAETEDFSYYN